jgi:hypothetical protein
VSRSLAGCHDAEVAAEPVDSPASESVSTSTTDTAPSHDGGLRRRAAYFYGLIVCGAVLAADPEDVRVWVLGVALVGTVLVYWVAETYVHWVAARSSHRRSLTRAESWATIADGFPLVLACAVPTVVLFIEAVAGISTPTAVQVALIVNVILLVGVGWRMNPSQRQLGWRRICYALATGLLGVAMIGLKTLLH